VKFINKAEPDFYKEFIRTNEPQQWLELSPIREKLRDYMLTEEQNHQCGYTELRIHSGNTSSHIDHFKKQQLFPELRFDYKNLIVANNNPEFGAKYKDVKLKNRSDYDNLLHPAEKQLNDRFSYNLGSGEIEAATGDVKAAFTIAAFGLNHPLLREKRKSYTVIILSYLDQFNVEDANGFVGEFESLIRYIYTV
jgi:uncharacterized protein (TIGR02646 family)